MEEADFDSTHPGFTIICDNCGSKKVYVEDTRGYSESSGPWGGVELACYNCGKRIDLVTA